MTKASPKAIILFVIAFILVIVYFYLNFVNKGDSTSELSASVSDSVDVETENSKTAAKDKTGATREMIAVNRSVTVSNAAELLNQLDGTILDSNELFSMNKFALKNKYDDSIALSYAAGMLYEAALRAGFIVGERQPHYQLPNYSIPGFDVKVEKKVSDFTFANPYPFPITIQASTSSISILGPADQKWKPVRVRIDERTIAPEKVRIESKAAIAVPTAAQGLLVKTYVTLEDREGKQEEFLASKDYYPAVPQIQVGTSAQQLPTQ